MPTNNELFKGIIIRNGSTEDKYDIAESISADVSTNIDVGGIPSGTPLKGMTFQDFVLALTVKDLAPTVTIFSPAANTIFKLGTTETVVLRADAIKKDTDIVRVDIYINDVLYKSIIDSVSISETITGLTANTTFRVRAVDATNYGESSRTVTFVHPSFYGIASNLTEVLQTAKGSTKRYTFVNDKAVYKYPKSFGALTKITDGSGITDYTASFERIEETIEGVAYYNYTLKDATTLTDFDFKFA